VPLKDRQLASLGGGYTPGAVLVKAVALALLGGLAAYSAAGAVVAARVRQDSLRDDPEHDLDLHALLSIVMCWPHDVQSLRGRT
jgi:hypothetical protein